MNASTGNLVIVVVGLPDAAVKESKDRVTTAVANSGYRWSKGRTTRFPTRDSSVAGPIRRPAK